MNRAAVWFGRIVWAGIAANLAMALPGLFIPDRLLGWFGLPVPDVLMWPRFASLLLILLSLFYIPAARDPLRYRPVAWLAVGARLAGVVFFLFTQSREYRMFGFFDLAFLLPEALLLYFALKESPPGSPARP